MIYEDEEDAEKALQFGLIAAHLNPSDAEEWVRLAEMSLERNNVRQAVVCYTKGRSDTSCVSVTPTIAQFLKPSLMRKPTAPTDSHGHIATCTFTTCKTFYV